MHFYHYLCEYFNLLRDNTSYGVMKQNCSQKPLMSVSSPFDYRGSQLANSMYLVPNYNVFQVF